MTRRIPGQWVPADVNLAYDPAIMKAGPMAELLFRRANEYCKKYSRDGVVYFEDLAVIAAGLPGDPRKLAHKLVDFNLWEAIDGGWFIRSYLKWNLSQDEIKAAAESKKRGALKTNHRRYHQDQPADDCPICQGGDPE